MSRLHVFWRWRFGRIAQPPGAADRFAAGRIGIDGTETGAYHRRHHRTSHGVHLDREREGRSHESLAHVRFTRWVRPRGGNYVGCLLGQQASTQQRAGFNSGSLHQAHRAGTSPNNPRASRRTGNAVRSSPAKIESAPPPAAKPAFDFKTAFAGVAKKGLGAYGSKEMRELADSVKASGTNGVRTVIEQLQDSTSTQDRFLLVALLESIGDPAALPALDTILKNDPDLLVRRMASHAAALIGSDAAMDVLRPAMANDQDWGVRVNSAYGLAKLKQQDGLDTLQQFYTSPDTPAEYRLAILAGTGRRCRPDDWPAVSANPCRHNGPRLRTDCDRRVGEDEGCTSPAHPAKHCHIGKIRNHPTSRPTRHRQHLQVRASIRYADCAFARIEFGCLETSPPRRNLPRFLIGVGVQLIPQSRDFMTDPVSRHGPVVLARRSFSEGGCALVFHHPDCTYFGVGETGA